MFRTVFEVIYALQDPHKLTLIFQEVAGMGFHLSQPGSSIATSLIDGEAKPKHVLLLEIKVSNYCPHKVLDGYELNCFMVLMNCGLYEWLEMHLASFLFLSPF